MEWNITSQGDYGVRLILSTGTVDIQPLRVNNTTFTFSRESREPLNVTLSAENVTMDFRIYYIKNLKSDSLVDALVMDVKVIASESDVSRMFTYNNNYDTISSYFDISIVFLDHLDVIMMEQLFKENNVSVEIRLKVPLNKEDSRYNISFSVTSH